jgi:hypothetical protein
MKVTTSMLACVAVLGGCATSGGVGVATSAAPPTQSDTVAGEQAVVPIARDLATALTNVMSPGGLPPAWANRVGNPSDAFKAKWASLVQGAHGEPVATLLDVGAVTVQSGNRAEVQATLILLGDGRVRWSTVAAREGAKVDANPTPGLTTTEPAVSELLVNLIKRLDSGPCQVAFLSGEDLLSLPAPLRGELGADLPTFADSCAIIRRHRDATWGPILEAAVVILRQGESYVAVAAHFQADTTSGKLVLDPRDVAPVTGPTMELAWSEAAAADAGATPGAAPKSAPGATRVQ